MASGSDGAVEEWRVWRQQFQQALEGIRANTVSTVEIGYLSNTQLLLGAGLRDVEALAQALSGNSSVTKLAWCSLQFGDEGATRLAAVLRESSIRDLALTACGIKDKGAKALAAVLVGTKLQVLDLSMNQIGDAGVIALAAALTTNEVKVLNLSANQVNDEGAVALAGALARTEVNVLNLSATLIGDTGAKGLAHALPGSKVKVLDLSNCQIGEEGAQAVLEALMLDRGGYTVSLEGSVATDRTMTQIRGALLEQVDPNNGRHRQQFEDLLRDIRENRVKIADLAPTECFIRSREAGELADALRENWSVRRLSFGGRHRLGDKGLQTLAAVLLATNIEELNLSHQLITDEGVAALAATLKASSVTEVDLSSNTVGAEGAVALVAGIQGSRVTTLQLPVVYGRIQEVLATNKANAETPDFVLQMQVEGSEPEWTLTFRTLAGTVATALQCWPEMCSGYPADYALPRILFRALRRSGFQLPSDRVRAEHLKIVKPGGELLSDAKLGAQLADAK